MPSDRKESKKVRSGKRIQPMLELLRDYRFNSIFFRSLIMILAVLLCAFFLILFLVVRRMDSILKEEVRSASQNSLDQAASQMDSVMEEASLIAARLSLDGDVMDFMLMDMTDTSAAYPETKNVKDRLEDYTGVFSYIDSIYVYSRRNEYVVSDTDGSPVRSFTDRNWYGNLTERIYEPPRMISRLKDGYYPYLISFIQPVRLTQMQFLGGIIINISASRISNYTSADGSEMFLTVDSRKNVIFSSEESYRMKKLTEISAFDDYDDSDTRPQTIEYEGQELLINTRPSDTFDWKYVAVVPTAKYRSYTRQLIAFALMLFVVIVILSAAASFLISVYSYTPIQHIVSLIKDPEKYDPDTTAILRKNETEEIIQNIVHNFYSNHELQEGIKEYLDITNRAQVTALQAQISPHFLYNTLESIRWQAIALKGGDNDVSKTILKLSQLLRISLDNEHPIISLREEIENAQIYVNILQLRYKDRLTVSWDIPEELEDCQIVKVSLQPVIENAVSHGIKPKRGRGTVLIRAWREEAKVFVEVSDDGVGMDDDECEALNRDMESQYEMKEGHIGVRNVNQRLKLLLGPEAGFTIYSKKGEGTRVVMSLPWVRMSGVTADDQKNVI